eukprot:4801566-Prorocentrum_lima.AAC.1
MDCRIQKRSAKLLVAQDFVGVIERYYRVVEVQEHPRLERDSRVSADSYHRQNGPLHQIFVLDSHHPR